MATYSLVYRTESHGHMAISMVLSCMPHSVVEAYGASLSHAARPLRRHQQARMTTALLNATPCHSAIHGHPQSRKQDMVI
jgi:hypothetical protein